MLSAKPTKWWSWDYALRRWADDDLRSLNAQIEWILRSALERCGRLKPPVTPEDGSSSREDAGTTYPR